MPVTEEPHNMDSEGMWNLPRPMLASKAGILFASRRTALNTRRNEQRHDKSSDTTTERCNHPGRGPHAITCTHLNLHAPLALLFIEADAAEARLVNACAANARAPAVPAVTAAGLIAVATLHATMPEINPWGMTCLAAPWELAWCQKEKSHSRHAPCVLCPCA